MSQPDTRQSDIPMPRGENSPPHISVVLATRNRPTDLLRALESLASIQYPAWDVLLVDQSDDTQSQEVASRYSSQLPRLVYRHMAESGLARARNAGLLETKGEILAFLDDDCTVDINWLDQIAAVFTLHPAAGLVFGSLKSALAPTNDIYVPAFEVAEEIILKRERAFFHEAGYGASMYLRRSAVERIGVFDVHMGAGATFFSSEDWDYYYRALAAGCTIVLTPAIVVWHYGGRTYQDGAASRLVRVSCFSHGALDMKLLRTGHAIAMPLIISRIWRDAREIRLRSLLARRGPTGLSRIPMYVRGLIASFQLKVDRRRCLYLPTESDSRPLST